MVRIRRLRYTLEPLRMEEALRDPYRVKVLRKVRNEQKKVEKNIDSLGEIHHRVCLIVSGHRRMCIPCVWPLGQERRGTKSCGPV